MKASPPGDRDWTSPPSQTPARRLDSGRDCQDTVGELCGVLEKRRRRGAAQHATIDVVGGAVTRAHVRLVAKPCDNARLVCADRAQRHEGVRSRVSHEEIAGVRLHQRGATNDRQR